MCSLLHMESVLDIRDGQSMLYHLLFCWILDVSDQSFSVSIQETRTVDNLKEEIPAKKLAMFANIEADQVTLWKVSSTLALATPC